MRAPTRQPQPTIRHQKACADDRRAGNELHRERIAELLEQWRSRQLESAQGWVECRGVSPAELEDIYQDTTLALLKRVHHSEEHLFYALRTGIRMRALKAHRDATLHEEILVNSAPEQHVFASVRETLERPDQTILAEEDRLIGWEFMTELTATEKEIFWFVVEGMSHNRIARLTGIDPNEVRRLMGACERKRELFEVLHRAGRLCGYREATILALQGGQATSEELARRAFAHLEGCAACRARHRTNAKRLRQNFQRQVAAVLPLPALARRLGWVGRAGFHAKVLAHRLLATSIGDPPSALRERAAIALAGGGAGVRLAAGLTAGAALTGAIGATRAIEHHHMHHAPPSSSEAVKASTAISGTALLSSVQVQPLFGPGVSVRTRELGPGHFVTVKTASGRDRSRSKRRDPHGFLYLAIPSPNNHRRPSSPATQTVGGPFSP